MARTTFLAIVLLYSCYLLAAPDYGVQVFNVHAFQRSDADGVYQTPGFVWHNNKLYFSGNEGVNGWQLWAYSPATNSTALAARLRQSTNAFGVDESSYPEIVSCGAGLFIRALTMKDPFGPAYKQSVLYMENDNFQQLELPANTVITSGLYSGNNHVLFLSWSDNQTRLVIFNCATKQLSMVDAPVNIEPWGPGFGGGIAIAGETVIYHGSFASSNNVVNTFNINSGVVTSVLPVNSAGVEFNQHRFITTPGGEVLLLSTMFFQPNADIYLGKLNPATGSVEPITAPALTQLLAQQQYFKAAKYFEYQARPGILLQAGSPAGLWFFDLSSYQISNLGRLLIDGADYTNNSSVLPDMTVVAGKIFYRHGIWDQANLVNFDAGPDDLLPLYQRQGNAVSYADGAWYFPGRNENGVELWRYRPGEGAVQLTDINTSPKSSAPANFTTHNGRLFFTANTTDIPNADNTFGPSLFKVESPDLQPVPLPAMPLGTSEPGLQRVFSLLGHNDNVFVTAQQNETDDIVVGLFHIPDNSYKQLYNISVEPLDYRRDKEVIYAFIYQHKYYAVLKYQSNELNDNGWGYKVKTALVWLDEAGQTQLAVDNMQADGSGAHQFHLLQDVLFYESFFEGGLHHGTALNLINLTNGQRQLIAEDAALIEQQQVPVWQQRYYAYNCFNALCLIDVTDGSLYQLEGMPLPLIDSFNLVADRAYITYFNNGARYMLGLDEMTLVSLPQDFATDSYGRPGLGVPFNLDANQLYVPGHSGRWQLPSQLWQTPLSGSAADFSLRLTYYSEAIADIGAGYPRFAVLNGDIWTEVQRQPGRIKSSAAMLYGDNPDYVKISTDFNGAGSVSASNSKITCGSNCADYLAKGAIVQLSAQAADGFKFMAWQGDCLAEGAHCSVTADSDKHIRAIFAPIRYDIVIEQDGRGEVIASTSQVTAEGQTVTLTLNPSRGYAVKATITGDCPAGTWLDEHTYETGIITQSCSLGVTFYRSSRRKFPLWLLAAFAE